MTPSLWILVPALGLIALAIYDLVQTRHAILRNFPVVGHFRYFIESLGPELRQYIVARNDEELPFSRDQRRWVYASAKEQNNYFGFGTDNNLELTPNYLIVKHSAFPLLEPRKGDPSFDPHYTLPVAKVLGGPRQRAKAFRPDSVVSVSGMSFGSLSSAAVEALNKGSRGAGCLHNTGEGGIAPHHDHGGELIWQIGTGYFGCRDRDGNFSLERLKEAVERYPVRALEIKLSQGAKPGLGGVLPAAKNTPEIAKIRLIEPGKDYISPARHTAFDGIDGLLDFAETLAAETGLPVGVKSAVGDLDFWDELARRSNETGKGLDFVSIDGGEGGTGAAPLTFSDHVALPFKLAMARVYRVFAEAGLHEKTVFIGSGKLGFPESALVAFALGCDMVAIAREAMLAIGCIQAQECHTGRCPTGVATQSRWLMRGLDPASKADRFTHYVRVLRKDLLRLSRACGHPHPALVGMDRLEILDDRFGSRSAREVFGYEPHWGFPSSEDQEILRDLMADIGQPNT